MKVLLSAYACEPNKGSEPEVGWAWALGLAKQGHEVWVITRSNNRQTIQAEMSKQDPSLDIHFIYVDLNAFFRKLKKLRGGIYPYYVFWQWLAFKTAEKLEQQQSFDFVHQVTFVSARLPSFMGYLRAPFIFGPVAGGERAPWALRKSYPLRGKILDGIRDIFNWFIKYDPLMRVTFKKADKIFVTSPQTKALLASSYQQKAFIRLAICAKDGLPARTEVNSSSTFRVIYAGRLIYWKGVHLAIRAFAQFVQSVPNARFTIVGAGEDKAWLGKIADECGVQDKIDWVGWLSQQELEEQFFAHDVFLFPSLHDSGGYVVLEALACQLPVVCLDLGGPGQIVQEQYGVKVNQLDSETLAISGLSQALLTARQKSSTGLWPDYQASPFKIESLIQSIYPPD